MASLSTSSTCRCSLNNEQHISTEVSTGSSMTQFIVSLHRMQLYEAGVPVGQATASRGTPCTVSMSMAHGLASPAHLLLVLRHLRRQRLHRRLHARLALPHGRPQLREGAVQRRRETRLPRLQDLDQGRRLGLCLLQLLPEWGCTSQALARSRLSGCQAGRICYRSSTTHDATVCNYAPR